MNSHLTNRSGKARGLAAAMLIALLLLAMVVDLPAAPADDDVSVTLTLQTTPARGQGFGMVQDLLVYDWAGLYGEGDLRTPRGMAAAGAREETDYYDAYLIVDSGRDRIQVWTEDDYYWFGPWESWGSSGTAPGKFVDPFDVAVDGNGDVYVTDTGKGYVQKFTVLGSYLGSFGSQGTGPGQFRSPTGITIDTEGHIYVGDRLNHNVQVFDADGTYLRTLGAGGRSPGWFGNPAGIAVDGDGAVYVVDYDSHNLQAFDAEGGFIGMWGSYGTGVGQFRHPFGIMVDGDGLIYVSDGSGRVQLFTPDGTALGAMRPQTGAAEPAAFADLVWSTWYNELYVIDLDRNGIWGLTVDSRGHWSLNDGESYTSETGWTDQPFTMTLHALPGLMPEGWALDEIVCDAGSPAMIPYGVALQGQPGQDINCTVTANGPAAALTVATERFGGTPGDHRFVLDPGSMAWVDQFDLPLFDWNSASSLVIDGASQVNVPDYSAKTVRVYDLDGNYLRHWGTPGTDPGEFMAPAGIGLAPDGSFYVTDYERDDVQRFDPVGDYLIGWGGEGTAEGQFIDPHGVAIDRSGNVYVADEANHRVQVFTGEGDFLRTWGWGVDDGSDEFQVCTAGCQAGDPNHSDEDGGLYYPRDIAVDNGGHVFVSSYGSTGISVFSTTGEFLSRLPVGQGGPMVVDDHDNLYNFGDFLTKFDTTGQVVARAYYRNDVASDFVNARGLAIAPDGLLYGLLVPWGPPESRYVQVIDPGAAAIADGQQQRFDLAPGRYLLSDVGLGDAWPFIRCDGGVLETARGRVTLNILPNDDITCTFGYGLAWRSYAPSVRR